MQQHEKPTLCRSKHGSLSVLHHGLAYAFTFKNIELLLAPEEIDAFKQSLEGLDALEWFVLSNGKFVLLSLRRFDASVYLTEEEVTEMIALLQEASAMVKVHQRLLNRVR